MRVCQFSEILLPEPRFAGLVLCQQTFVGRDSEIAPTAGLLMVGGNSDSRLFSAIKEHLTKH